MEYLGGGSCLDLVCPTVALRWDALLTITVKTRKLQRSPRRNRLPRTAPGIGLLAQRRQDSPGCQSRQCPAFSDWKG
jgi:hypothetical protein